VEVGGIKWMVGQARRSPAQWPRWSVEAEQGGQGAAQGTFQAGTFQPPASVSLSLLLIWRMAIVQGKERPFPPFHLRLASYFFLPCLAPPSQSHHNHHLHQPFSRTLFRLVQASNIDLLHNLPTPLDNSGGALFFRRRGRLARAFLRRLDHTPHKRSPVSA
jgi:hypothetical protein